MRRNARCLPGWLVEAGAEGTVYAGETFRLRIRFPSNYPIEAPEVVFVPVSFAHCFVWRWREMKRGEVQRLSGGGEVVQEKK